MIRLRDVLIPRDQRLRGALGENLQYFLDEIERRLPKDERIAACAQASVFSSSGTLLVSGVGCLTSKRFACAGVNLSGTLNILRWDLSAIESLDAYIVQHGVGKKHRRISFVTKKQEALDIHLDKDKKIDEFVELLVAGFESSVEKWD